MPPVKTTRTHKPTKASANWKELCKKLKTKPITKPRQSNRFGVSHENLEHEAKQTQKAAEESLTGASQQKAGKYIAIDCEMVGVGPNGLESALARVSIVNFHGHVLLDAYVLPIEEITDFRTSVSGITASILREHGRPLSEIQKIVHELCINRIVIGHDIQHDFRALMLSHPTRMLRDTSRYLPFKKMNRGHKPSLRKLAKALLGLDIQNESHSSVDDAKVTMLIYRQVKEEWERSISIGGTHKLAKR